MVVMGHVPVQETKAVPAGHVPVLRMKPGTAAVRVFVFLRRPLVLLMVLVLRILMAVLHVTVLLVKTVLLLASVLIVRQLMAHVLMGLVI